MDCMLIIYSESMNIDRNMDLCQTEIIQEDQRHKALKATVRYRDGTQLLQLLLLLSTEFESYIYWYLSDLNSNIVVFSVCL